MPYLVAIPYLVSLGCTSCIILLPELETVVEGFGVEAGFGVTGCVVVAPFLITNTCPGCNPISFIIGLFFSISSTLTLYNFEIEYNVSLAFTVCILPDVGLV